MSRYENGKIYKLVNNADKEIYIGSTCLPLHKRFYGHKTLAQRRPERKVYKHLNTIGWDEVKIILIESFPCINKMELEKRERYYIDKLTPSLNTSLRPYVTEEERKKSILLKNQKSRATEYLCDVCQITSSLDHKARHIKTKKHQLMAAEQLKTKEETK